MATAVHVPDIGDFADVDVIEVLVNPGDTVALNDPLITLESDKAAMEVPSPLAGTVQELSVRVGDKVSEGSLIAMLEPQGDAASQTAPEASTAGLAHAGAEGGVAASAAAQPETADTERTGTANEVVRVPDLGEFANVPVIELMVAEGDMVDAEQPLITIESDKAAMEVPAPRRGRVSQLLLAVGDAVSTGTPILRLEPLEDTVVPVPVVAPAPSTPSSGPSTAPPDRMHSGGSATAEGRATTPSAASGVGDLPGETGPSLPRDMPEEPIGIPREPPTPPAPLELVSFAEVHASPSVRRFARELGVDLTKVEGTGRKGRISMDDVRGFVKRAMQTAQARADAPASAAEARLGEGERGIPPIPDVDASAFGPTEVQPLNRIKRLTGENLFRNWVNIPHVTYQDEADITELEAFRKSMKAEAEARGVRLTAMVFILKALVQCLREFPQFNASLDASGENLILKRYFHIGVAVDTPAGLVVPVVRDVDQLGLFDLAEALKTMSTKARERKLKTEDIQGGCITVSNLGGIGGTVFTPIINAPEVAILGLTRGQMRPVWNGSEFAPRLMQPLALSFDHRVIDGAEAARFIARLGWLLGDIRRLLV